MGFVDFLRMAMGWWSKPPAEDEHHLCGDVTLLPTYNAKVSTQPKYNATVGLLPHYTAHVEAREC